MLFTKHNQDWETFYSVVKGKRLVLFGAGHNARAFIVNNNDIHSVEYICDNDTAKIGGNVLGIPVVSPMRLKDESADNLVILITPHIYQGILETDLFSTKTHYVFLLDCLTKNKSTYFTEHQDELLLTIDLLADDLSKNILLKIVEKRTLGIDDYSDIYTPNQYYLPEMYENSIIKDEIIIDAGAEVGGTIKAFINRFGNAIKRIYAFEPAPVFMEQLRKTASRFSDYSIITHQCGLSSTNGTSSFVLYNNWLGGSHLNERRQVMNEYFLKACEPNAITVTINRLDDIIPNDEKITFIKMDIEGAEYNALEGARSIIQKHKPRLAICLYHSDFDYIQIPQLIREMVPEYKLYIRHHLPSWAETVLYAFI